MLTLGVDLGGTTAVAVLVDDEGSIVERTDRPTGRGLGPDAAVELIAGLLHELGVLDPAAIGVGFPGPVDARRGVIHSSPILDGWSEVDLGAAVRAVTGVPCVVDNDVNDAARAEVAARRRAGRPADELLLVNVGTGIGGAIVLDGRVRSGATGGAGEIGHVPTGADGAPCPCGGRGCAHLRAGGRALEQRLGLTPGGLAAAVARGDADALAAIEEAAEHLGFVVAGAVNLLDVPLVVIGGGLSGHPGFVDTLAGSFRQHAMAHVADSCRIEHTLVGTDAGAIGSALLARSG